MPEMITISREELEHLQERTRKLARDKSHLQMVNSLMNKVSAAQGLDNMISALLSNILDVIGGVNISLYYLIDNDMFIADVFGKQAQINRIDDELVSKAFEFRIPIETEHDFSDTKMLTTEFTKAYTWAFPLLAGPELIGVIKLENLHISMRELYNQQPAFFSYIANVLKNELHGRSRLKIANDHLRELNEALQSEIAERGQTELELRQARDELEARVLERTAELQNSNEQLQLELAERRRDQELMLKYSEEIQDLYNRAPCGYHSLDEGGLIIRINDTELQWLGYQRDEIVGRKRFSDIISARSLQNFQKNFHHFKERGCVKDLKFELVRKDGSILPVLVSATAVFDENGAYVMSRSTLYDITAWNKAEEEITRLNRELEERVKTRTGDLNLKRGELEDSQRALLNIVDDLNLKTEELEEANAKLLELDRLKSLFIASMSHELRTPLNSIIGFSSILRDEWLGPVSPEQKENLDTIRRSGKHLLSLINDVIDVSKIEAGKIEVRLEEFDLYDLMTEAVQYVETELRDKGLELHLELHHHTFCTDKCRLLQCVINLLSNAVKFTEHGLVSVSSGCTDTGQIVIHVNDTGIGIAKQDIPKLFEPFVRLESSLKITVPGTGLGLYLTRKLVVEVLRGDILCESELGKGSTFTIHIPERIHEKSIGSGG